MQTSTPPAPLTDTQKATLATLLGPWAVIPGTEGYDATYRTTLRYTGSEPLLQGATLHLNGSSYGHRGMLHCHGGVHVYDGTEHHALGNFLNQGDRDTLNTDINISATKAVDQIAKDLQRRLLPPYLDGYKLGMVALATAQARHARQRTSAAQIAALLPDGKVKGGERLSDETRIWWKGPHWRISPYSVSIEGFSMTQAQAGLLATLLASQAWTDAATESSDT